MIKSFIWSIVFLLLLFTSCGTKRAKTHSSSEPNIFPDYKGVTIPYNIAPLNFSISEATHIVAHFLFNDKLLFSAQGEGTINIEASSWREALTMSRGGKLTVKVEVWTEKDKDGTEYAPFEINVSQDSIMSYIAYRLIPPGYEHYNKMGIYQRNLTNFEESAIITNNQNNKGCVNCHSFSAYSPEKMMFHSRGENGGTVILNGGKLEKVSLPDLPGGKSGTYPYWHPSGNYIAFSSNTTNQSFYGRSKNKIEVYDLKSDIIIYDMKNGRILSDSRFSTEQEWETFPAFSPDGKYLYFCTAHKRDMPVEASRLKYSIVRVTFDEHSGMLGDKVDTVYSASRSRKSGQLPRLSPDGRFLLFTECTSGTFPIYHKDANIEMINLKTMKRVNTNIINSQDVDSYHSWSSNGRWIILSSKRIDGRYTRLFIAHSDKNGKLGKPFLLPQESPERNVTCMDSYNVPEFINGKVNVDKNEMANLFKR